MKVLTYIAQATGIMTDRILRLSGRSATALPGYVAENIDPDILSSIIKQRDIELKILITGTNGKTTTTRLIAEILSADGYYVVSNLSGSNLYRGVVSTLLNDRKYHAKTALVLEVDEASMPRVTTAVDPHCVVVLNLFRDQLDRYGEVSLTQEHLREALARTANANLVLCSDDPWVAMLGIDRATEVKYFGLTSPSLQALPHDHAADFPLAPVSQASLKYSQRYFSHLGKYTAVDGSWKRPSPDMAITKFKEVGDKQLIEYTMLKKQHKLSSKLLGIYNLYNIAAAVSLTNSIGVAEATIKTVIDETGPAFGRQEIIEYQGTMYQFYLIKNPTGFNQVIQGVFADSVDNRATVIIVNDNFADGRDVSWLWDCALEDMVAPETIIVSGVRAYDMALRLKYAGINCTVEPNIGQALDKARATSTSIRVLPTYTALIEARQHLGFNLGKTS